MKIDPSQQSRQDNYKLLIGSIVPRPIAFVTSVNQSGGHNAAPFSFFNIAGVEPPLIMFSCMRKTNGEQKDTARNIAGSKEFIVHIVSEEIVEQVNFTSIDAPPEVDELALTDLTTVAGELVQVPRVVEAKIAMECKLYQHVVVGQDALGRPTADIIIGEVVRFHIDDALYENGRIDLRGLNPMSRLAGLFYGKVGETFERPRPVWDKGTGS